jgi:hypothetical protein
LSSPSISSHTRLQIVSQRGRELIKGRVAIGLKKRVSEPINTPVQSAQDLLSKLIEEDEIVHHTFLRHREESRAEQSRRQTKRRGGGREARDEASW